MTRDVRVGRVLVAALQQAIAEELPTRSEFYDHWLGPDGRRDGTLGVAPMAAVVGFLKTEGDGYQRVVTRAGTLVAQWTWQEWPAWRRQGLARLPQWWRLRAACRRAGVVARETCPTTILRGRVNRAVVTVDVSGSVFCQSRETPASPLCGFYAALVAGVFKEAGLLADGGFDRCRARADRGRESGEAGCGGAFQCSVIV